MDAIGEALAQGADVGLWAAAAHEVGHGVAFRVAGLPVRRLHVTAGWLGGVSGFCELGPTGEVSDRAFTGYLVGLMAGAAAQQRFLTRYARHTAGSARRTATSCAGRDESMYRSETRRGDLPIGSARSRAASLVNAHGGRIDRLTVRLARTGRLSGGAL